MDVEASWTGQAHPKNEKGERWRLIDSTNMQFIQRKVRLGHGVWFIRLHFGPLSVMCSLH